MKRGLKILGIVVAAVIVIAVALPFFINANMFRPRLESELSDTLGRQVKVGNLSLSIFSGGVKADDISISDDPTFSKQPFVQAQSLKVGVEMIPLIFSKSLHVTEIALNSPQINLIRSENGTTWNFSSIGSKPGQQPTATGQPQAAANAQPQQTSQPPNSSAESTPNISIAKLEVTNGRVTVSTLGSGEPPRIYDKAKVDVKDFSLANSFPFKASVDLPGGGTFNLDGNAGPINAGHAEQTPLNAKVQIHQMNLAQSGFIDPASGISGIADFDGTVSSDGHVAKTNGTLKATKLQVAQKGSPAGEPVEFRYAADYDIARQAGKIDQGDLAMGKAVAHITGTYDTHGKTTVINMKVNGDGMPVDDLEAMLPAFGVVLPPGSKLKGGTLNLNTTSTGPVDKLVTIASVKLQNSALAGFNMGQRLSAISALSGKSTGNDTVIQNFSADAHISPEGTQAQNINLTVPAIGVMTGAGTVSPANALDFKMVADLGGAAKLVGLGSQAPGIPFTIQGTTSDPKFMPDMKGLAKGLLKQTLGGNAKKNPLGGLGGLFKSKSK